MPIPKHRYRLYLGAVLVLGLGSLACSMLGAFTYEPGPAAEDLGDLAMSWFGVAILLFVPCVLLGVVMLVDSWIHRVR